MILKLLRNHEPTLQTNESSMDYKTPAYKAYEEIINMYAFDIHEWGIYKERFNRSIMDQIWRCMWLYYTSKDEANELIGLKICKLGGVTTILGDTIQIHHTKDDMTIIINNKITLNLKNEC